MQQNIDLSVICADEARERSIQEDHWLARAPTSSIGMLMRMQERTKFNNEMNQKYRGGLPPVVKS